MKKRFLSLVLVIGLLLGLNVSYVSANDDITVIVNGETIDFDVPPIVENNRILVPVRNVFEKLGATVSWDQENQFVRAQKKDIEILLPLNGDEFVKNWLTYPIDVPAKSINERILVPLRAVSEALDCKVVWDGASKTVNITSPKDLVCYEMVEETVVKKTAKDDINITVTYKYPQITDGKSFLTEFQVERVNQIAKKFTYDLYDYDEYAYSFVDEWGEVAIRDQNLTAYTQFEVSTSLTTSDKFETISFTAVTEHPWMGIVAESKNLSKEKLYEDDFMMAMLRVGLDSDIVYQEMFNEFSDRIEDARYFDKENVYYTMSDDKLTFFMSSIDITGVGRYGRYYAVSKEY